jgi:hypothetical protein
MLQQGSGDEVTSARQQTLPKREVTQVAQWDVLTLRDWFNTMDMSCDGSITRHDWFGFLVNNPQLRDILLSDSGQPVKDRFSRAASQDPRHQAFRTRQVMKFVKEVVFDNSETIEFEEFVEFFRRTGHLVEYQSDANPRVQMAGLLGDIHNRDKAVVSDAEARQMVQLAKQNLQGQRRKSVEWNMSRPTKNLVWLSEEGSRDATCDVTRTRSC